MVYYDFPGSDTSSIAAALETYSTQAQIEPHMHQFYEFALIAKGTCTHYFRGVEAPLVMGDVFIIPPHEEHGYRVDGNTSIYNCYFFPERLEGLTGYVHEKTFQEPAVPAGLYDVKQQWDSLLGTISLRDRKKIPNPFAAADYLFKQGVLHLEPAAALDVEDLLMRLHREHMDPQYDAEYMKSAILQMILVIFKRARYNVPRRPPSAMGQKKMMILDSLIFIEENYSGPLMVREIAEASSMSESYFRNIFKEVTGLSPLDYLNRMRVVKALEYLQVQGTSVAEAAEKVGIPDANYFSRLFKKLMGRPPRCFKKNETAGEEEKSE